MAIKISIVVAAYNVETYIERCLMSLKNQTFKEIEVIVINDGSTDNTLAIAKNFEKDDRRFRVISQKNLGLSSARNLGIKNARGKYIAFMDADDFADYKMYELLYREIEKGKSDLAICSFYKVWERKNSGEIESKKIKLNTNILRGDIVQNFLCKHYEAFVVAWNKLYKLKIIKNNNIYFKNKAFFEDLGFMPRYLYYCNSITWIEDQLYYYVQREGSITQSYNPIIRKSLSDTYKLLIDFFKEEESYLKGVELLKVRMEIYNYNYCLKTDRQANFKPKFSYNNLSLPLKHNIALLLIKLNPKLYKKIGKSILKVI
ncbi:glycosyltransferase family 2 protein [Hathewaya histolytica]|uniref:Glycosyl transferase family protein n=1 Tax=Hathewaya histolytica TaxID=1498 RepID=A0A4U9R925_HATHI|nr:glycosyltransferase family 2 protein [Hathewaya histolytica]VTQ87231.1 glycosyl transferase family protein [Hathewaya histolytica]